MTTEITLTQNADGTFDGTLSGVSVNIVPYVAPVVVPPAPAAPPPVPDAVFAFTQNAGRVGVIQDASVNIPDGSKLGINWGTKDGIAIVLHGRASYRFPAGGDYTVTETIKAPDGTVIATSQQAVTIIDDGTVPPTPVTPPPPSAPAPVPAPAPAPAPAPVLPPVAPVSGSLPMAVVTGTVGGVAVDVTVGPGQRMMLVPLDFSKGSVMYDDDGSLNYENGYAGVWNPTPADFTASLNAQVGGKSFSTGDITLGYKCGTRPHWIVEPVAGDYNPDLFPCLEVVGSEKATRVASYANADNSITGTSFFVDYEPGPGERDEIGGIINSDACHLVNPSAESAAVVRGTSDAVAAMPVHLIDCVTNKMLIASDYSHCSDMGIYLGIAGNPIQKYKSAVTFQPNSSHAPAFGVLASSMYKTKFDQRMVSDWTNYITRLCYNYTYLTDYSSKMGAVAGLDCPGVTNQTRGKAWELRTLAQASHLASEEHRAMFASWTNKAISYYADKQDKQTGIQIDQDADSTGYKYHGYAGWQEDYLVSMAGFVIHLGFPTAQRLLDYNGLTVMDTMDQAQHEQATNYNNCMRDATGRLCDNYKDGLKARETFIGTDFAAQAIRQNAAAEDSEEMQLAIYNLPAASPLPYYAKVGDMDGYPVGASGNGRPAVHRTAIVALMDYATDQVRAQAVGAKFFKYDRTPYNTGPKYHWKPRAKIAPAAAA
jgi:hypothetical protein